MAKPKKEGFSNAFRDATEGFLTDHNVTVKDAYYCLWEEAGEQALVEGREADDVCLTLELVSMDDPEHEFRPERLGAGKAASVAPSEDQEEPSKRGPFLCRSNEESKARGLSKQTKAYPFIKSCIKPAEGKLKLSEADWDARGTEALIGLSFHYVVVNNPDTNSLMKKLSLCQEVLELPEKGAASAAKKAAASKKKKDADEDAEEPEEKDDESGDEGEEEESDASSTAETIVAGVLEKAGGPVKKDDLTKKSFTAMSKIKDKKQRSEILELMQDDEWLGDDDRPWQYNEKKGLLTPVE